MITIVFPDSRHFAYELCGKFQAPSAEWMHLTRDLVDFELMVVTSGTLYIASHQERYTVREGEYLLMPPTPHQHGYQKGACSFYWLHFLPLPPGAPVLSSSGSSDEGLFHPVPDPSLYHLRSQEALPGDYCDTFSLPLSGRLAAFDRVIILLKQLQDTSLRYHNPELNSSLTCAVLGEIACQSPLYRSYAAQNQRTQVLQDLISYIQYHCCEDLRVSALADAFGYNAKYLSSLFRSEMGITLKQFIIKARMDTAMAELTDTNHPVSQIAYNVGFRDVHNFASAFRKLTGLTPTQYRKGYETRHITFE